MSFLHSFQCQAQRQSLPSDSPNWSTDIIGTMNRQQMCIHSKSSQSELTFQPYSSAHLAKQCEHSNLLVLML